MIFSKYIPQVTFEFPIQNLSQTLDISEVTYDADAVFDKAFTANSGRLFANARGFRFTATFDFQRYVHPEDVTTIVNAFREEFVANNGQVVNIKPGYDDSTESISIIPELLGYRSIFTNTVGMFKPSFKLISHYIGGSVKVSGRSYVIDEEGRFVIDEGSNKVIIEI